MSDHIPIEIQLSIMERLPVKSLIQFRSVSKTWKSLIDSRDFIINHYTCHHSPSQVQHLLVRYEHRLTVDDEVEQKYVSIADDYSFPQPKVSFTSTLPPLVTELESPRIIGSSHGLLGLYSPRSHNSLRRDNIVIWNPSIGKAVSVIVPNKEKGRYDTTFGFGVCRETNDPKIVKITYFFNRETVDMETVTRISFQVEVFALSTGVWRRSRGNLPRETIEFNDYINKVVIDGVIYWLVEDRITIDGDCRSMVISFDVTSEEIREIALPDKLAQMGYAFTVSNIGDSLVVVGQHFHAAHLGMDVWMMGDGDRKTFTKIFNFRPIEDYLFTGFRKSGQLIFELPKQGDDVFSVQLAVYDPCSKRIDNLGIDGLEKSFFACHYMETLLLLDQPNLRIYTDN